MAKHYTRKRGLLALAAGFGLSAAVAYASTANISYSFSPGSPASANEVNTNFIDLKTAIDDNDLRVAALEAIAGGQAAPVTIDCATASATAVQDAIDNSAPDGPLVVTLNGVCIENVVIRRDDVTLAGGTSGGLTAAAASAAAIEVNDASKVAINDLVITGGLNGISVIHNASASLSGNTISGAVQDPNMAVPTGSALFVDIGSAVEIQNSNSFTGSGADEAVAVFVFRSSHVKLSGNNNSFNPGTPQGADEPYALEAAIGSSFLQEVVGTGNAVTGGIAVSSNAQMFLQAVTITGFIDIEESSLLTLYPASPLSIVVNSDTIEVGLSSTLDIADDGIPLDINAGGVTGLLRLLDHASLLLYSGSTINMDVEMFRSSSIDAGDDSTIGGYLNINNFSTAVFNGITSSAVAGSVTCGAAEAYSFDTGNVFTDLCL